jgi:hypothetical protein
MPTARVVTFTATIGVALLCGTGVTAGAPAEQQRPAAPIRFSGMDQNGDGVITRAEWRGSEQAFRANDWNDDGILSGEEVRPGGRRRAQPSSDNVFDVPAAPARGASRQGDCVSSAPRIVDDVYQQVLERPADPSTAQITQDLAAGRVSVREVVEYAAKSPEHAERFYWQPVVSTVYKQVLQREPNQQEVRSAMTALTTGGQSMSDVVAQIAMRGARGEGNAVRVLYRRLLGREPDPEGLRAHQEVARRDGIEAVARSIMNSPEYRSRAGANGLPADDMAAYEVGVRSLYRHVLGRNPDPNGLRELTSIAAASGFDAVVNAMINSEEYERSFGDDVVPGRGARYCAPTGGW